MKIFVSGRRAGKTYKTIEWVKQGKEIRGYPYWDRVILTISIAEADRLRKQYNLDYRQVFSVHEWQHRRHGTGRQTEVVLDNADIILQDLVGPLVGTTMTGEEWSDGEEG